MAGVLDAKIMALPDPPPLAETAKLPPALYETGVAGAKPVMFCAISAAGETVKDCGTAVAAL